MTEKEMQKLAGIVLNQLEQKEKLKKDLNPYRKTEKLLKYYNIFKKKLEIKREELKNIVIKHSSGVAGGGEGTFSYKADIEKIEDKREFLEEEIQRYEKIILKVDNALEEIKQDKYYSLIELRYFQNCRWEDIEERLEIDHSTIYRNIKRLINELSVTLFPEQLLDIEN
ncbi:MAG TPA: sigma-70 family RNA polymerase sigma factor [Fusobacterium sp.]|uniref:sigma-70 family RNA polymerase sigma factor n=1 Tax=Fusobacterium sp. TaxID=68766 RepID=UPI002F4272A5